MKKKRVAYPSATPEESRRRQKEANDRYAAKNPYSTRRVRDIARLGLAEYNRRRAAISETYRQKNPAKVEAALKKYRATPEYKEHRRAWQAAYRAENRASVRAKMRAWNKANRERVNARRREQYKNPEHKAKINKWNAESYVRHTAKRVAAVYKWKAANPDKAKEIGKRGVMKRRSLKPAGRFTRAAFYNRCNYFGWLCVYCKTALTKKTVTIEHFIPLSKGGSNWPSNLAPACEHCNKTKHARNPSEWKR